MMNLFSYFKNILIELYKKQIWNDAKTVNVIAASCFCKIAKVVAMALQFFLGKDVEKEEKDSDSDVKLIHSFHFDKLIRCKNSSPTFKG
jgi:hypothetical protein